MGDKKVKKNKKAWTYEELVTELQAVKNSKKVEINKIANIFGRIKDCKGVKKEDIETLFRASMEKSGDDGWKFLLEVYSRFYNKGAAKNIDKIISLIKNETESKLGSVLSIDEINSAILEMKSGEGRKKLEKLCSSIKPKKEKEPIIIDIALLYIFLLIKTKELIPMDFSEQIRVIERIFFECFAKDVKNDPLFVKEMKDSIISGTAFEKMREMTHLYQGVEDVLAELQENNERDRLTIKEKIARIVQLENHIAELEEVCRQNNLLIQNQQNQIAELNRLLTETDNRNEFNENMYEQQFQSLKRSFIEKVKKGLKLEVDGLEDIAEGLDENQRKKIQRRIDNIYKFLQKMGE